MKKNVSDSVGFFNVEKYDTDLIYNKLITAFDLLKIKIKKKQIVLIKPNIISQNYPKQCTTTHPAVIDAVCRILKDLDCKIIIAESSAFYQGGYTEKGFYTSGIVDIAEQYNAETVCIEKNGSKFYTNNNNKVLKSILLTKSLDEADYIINMPKLKTHAFFKLSCAVKNLYGLIPGGVKQEYHYICSQSQKVFGEKLCDIYKTVQPDLNIMDGIWGLEGFGPSAAGTPKKTGIICVAENPFALDYSVSRMIGYDPDEIQSNHAGMKRGLYNPEEINIKGDYDKIPDIFYKKPKVEEAKNIPKEKTMLNNFILKPEIKAKKCSMCLICAESCPFGAITISDNIKTVDRNKCLSCYFCFYNCPDKAIYLKASFLNLFIRAFRRIFRI